MAFANPVDAGEYTTEYEYDALSRLTEAKTVYNGEPVSTSYGYDEAGNKTSVTDALGHVTRYSYDAMNRVQNVKNADGTTISYEYDLAGNKTAEVRPTGAWHFEYEYFQVSMNVWNSLTSSQQWALNRAFLDKAISNGSTFLVEAAGQIKDGSYLQQEIQYLLQNGYHWLEDLSALVK